MLILGIDPGTATTGWGLIKKLEESDFEIIEWGLIETKKETKPHIRLHEIHEQMLQLLDKFKPDVLVMEKIFLFNNAKTVIRVTQAQGVILLASASYTLDVFEYAPGTIKKHVAGNGRANKKEVEAAVREILGKKLAEQSLKDSKGNVRKMTLTYIDNAIDALAIAICHSIMIHDETVKKNPSPKVQVPKKKKQRSSAVVAG